MSFMNALDTNIWIYAHDRRDAEKQKKAQAIIAQERPLALPWQVGCEFIAACRKLESQGFTAKDAWDALADMQTLADVVLLPCSDLWFETRHLLDRHQLSFWDALLVAACIRGGVQVLYSEDIAGDRVIEGLKVINPFVASSGTG